MKSAFAQLALTSASPAASDCSHHRRPRLPTLFGARVSAGPAGACGRGAGGTARGAAGVDGKVVWGRALRRAHALSGHRVPSAREGRGANTSLG